MNLCLRNVSDMVVAIYLIINGCEWLYLSSKRELFPMIGKHTVFLRLQDRGWSKLWARISSKLIMIIGVWLPAAGMICLGLALFVAGATSKVFPLISVTAFITVVIFNATIAVGLEGSDQMATLVLFVNAVTSLAPHLQWVTDFFIFAQLILSYGVAGVAKLLSADWRSGRAIVMIVSTRSFGLGSASFFTRHIWLAKVVCTSIIAYEILWFAAPLNKEVMLILMALGVIFHFSNSWIMGLNLFPWAFLSAYPLAINAINRLHS